MFHKIFEIFFALQFDILRCYNLQCHISPLYDSSLKFEFIRLTSVHKSFDLVYSLSTSVVEIHLKYKLFSFYDFKIIPPEQISEYCFEILNKHFKQ